MQKERRSGHPHVQNTPPQKEVVYLDKVRSSKRRIESETTLERDFFKDGKSLEEYANSIRERLEGAERKEAMKWLFDMGEKEVRTTVNLVSLASRGQEVFDRHIFENRNTKAANKSKGGLRETDSIDETVDWLKAEGERWSQGLLDAGITPEVLRDQLEFTFHLFGMVLENATSDTDQEWFADWRKRVDTLINDLYKLADASVKLEDSEIDDFTEKRLNKTRMHLLEVYGTPLAFSKRMINIRTEITELIKKAYKISNTEWSKHRDTL